MAAQLLFQRMAKTCLKFLRISITTVRIIIIGEKKPIDKFCSFSIFNIFFKLIIAMVKNAKYYKR
jgi:hypothetical protein